VGGSPDHSVGFQMPKIWAFRLKNLLLIKKSLGFEEFSPCKNNYRIYKFTRWQEKKIGFRNFAACEKKGVKKFSPKKKSPACEIFPFTRKNADFDDI
jgi:hypothetical protein